MKVIGAFIQVFHFKLVEIEGYFILGWATEKSRKLAPTGLQALELILSPVTIEKNCNFHDHNFNESAFLTDSFYDHGRKHF